MISFLRMDTPNLILFSASVPTLCLIDFNLSRYLICFTLIMTRFTVWKTMRLRLNSRWIERIVIATYPISNLKTGSGTKFVKHKLVYIINIIIISLKISVYVAKRPLVNGLVYTISIRLMWIVNSITKTCAILLLLKTTNITSTALRMKKKNMYKITFLPLSKLSSS